MTKCWWKEGNRCYSPEKGFKHDPEKLFTTSEIIAECPCEHYWDKVIALSSVIPRDKLIVTSVDISKEQKTDFYNTLFKQYRS